MDQMRGKSMVRQWKESKGKEGGELGRNKGREGGALKRKSGKGKGEGGGDRGPKRLEYHYHL